MIWPFFSWFLLRMHSHAYSKTMHAIENVRSECSKFILIFTWPWGNVILWSQGSRWSVSLFFKGSNSPSVWKGWETLAWDALEGLDKDLGRRNEKCPMVYISLLSPPLQQPKLNPAGADRAQWVLPVPHHKLLLLLLLPALALPCPCRDPVQEANSTEKSEKKSVLEIS